MNLHEEQAKELARRYGIAVPADGTALSAQQALLAAQTLGGPLSVVKASARGGLRHSGRRAAPAQVPGAVRRRRTFAPLLP